MNKGKKLRERLQRAGREEERLRQRLGEAAIKRAVNTQDGGRQLHSELRKSYPGPKPHGTQGPSDRKPENRKRCGVWGLWIEAVFSRAL